MSAHIPALRVYWATFATLIVLTALTTGVAFIDMGRAGDYVALTIASLKTLVVALFFMHLRYSSRFMALVAGAGIFWLLLLFVLALSDYSTRGAVVGWS